MNAMRITQLLALLARDYDMDGDLAEQGCDEDSVLLRSGDERLEVVLRFEAEEWEIHYAAHESDDHNILVVLKGEGWGNDIDGGDLTDALGLINDFISDLGV